MPTTSERHYKRLFQISKEIRTLQGISSLLDWDQETYMPPAGIGIRAEQLKVLAGLAHKAKTGSSFKHTLGKLIDLSTGKILSEDLSDAQKAALREWLHDYHIDKALPRRFVEAWAKITSQAIEVWRHAHSENAFHQFAPFLERIVTMARKKAEYLGYTHHPYDALLDLYEPGIGTTEITPLFARLKTVIQDLLKKIPNPAQVEDRFLRGPFLEEKQMQFGKQLLETIGYDSKYGRIDLSTHPSCSSCHPTDIRLTTRIRSDALMENISACIHEFGHALYDRNLLEAEYGSPLGEPRSYGIHESQSRWWETIVGLSKPFWSHFLPILQKVFPKELESVTLDQFYRAINKVKPVLIRVESDEVTYPLHIILRYELERALIEGSLKVREVPEAWNAKMQELLGLTPKTNKDGCLQDIHWAMGGFGYFPSYALGNMYAAHLFAGFERSNPSWSQQVVQGDFSTMREWLAKKVHHCGRRYSTQELLQQASGMPFSSEAYESYLSKKSNINQGGT